MSVVKLDDLEKRAAAGESIHPDIQREARLMLEKCRMDAEERKVDLVVKTDSVLPEPTLKKARVHIPSLVQQMDELTYKLFAVCLQTKRFRHVCAKQVV